jgi:hypothetical protein
MARLSALPALHRKDRRRMKDAGLSRRWVLTAGGLLAASACTRGGRPTPAPRLDPDVAIRRAAAADVSALLALYAVNSQAHPGLASRLAPLAAETTAHLAAVRPPAATSTATPATPTATGSASVSSPPPAPTVTEALTTLAAAERQAAARRAAQLTAASPALARLLAAVGASEATHAMLLSERA